MWKLSFKIRQSSGRMIIIMIVELVERRFPPSWTSLEEVWHLTHYDKVALKAGRKLKEGHGTVSSEFFSKLSLAFLSCGD